MIEFQQLSPADIGYHAYPVNRSLDSLKNSVQNDYNALVSLLHKPDFTNQIYEADGIKLILFKQTELLPDWSYYDNGVHIEGGVQYKEGELVFYKNVEKISLNHAGKGLILFGKINATVEVNDISKDINQEGVIPFHKWNTKQTSFEIRFNGANEIYGILILNDTDRIKLKGNTLIFNDGTFINTSIDFEDSYRIDFADTRGKIDYVRYSSDFELVKGSSPRNSALFGTDANHIEEMIRTILSVADSRYNQLFKEIGISGNYELLDDYYVLLKSQELFIDFVGCGIDLIGYGTFDVKIDNLPTFTIGADYDKPIRIKLASGLDHTKHRVHLKGDIVLSHIVSYMPKADIANPIAVINYYEYLNQNDLYPIMLNNQAISKFGYGTIENLEDEAEFIVVTDRVLVEYSAGPDKGKILINVDDTEEEIDCYQATYEQKGYVIQGIPFGVHRIKIKHIEKNIHSIGNNININLKIWRPIVWGYEYPNTIIRLI